MTIISQRTRFAGAWLAVLVFMAGALTISRPAVAQAPAQTKHHMNWVQKHPTMTAVGAAVVTHHMLKKSAAYKKAHGQRLNFAERHPTLSAVGVGVVTHHIIKKHTPRE